MDGFIRENKKKNMDENWGYPYFRKPPHGYIRSRNGPAFLHTISYFKIWMWIE